MSISYRVPCKHLLQSLLGVAGSARSPVPGAVRGSLSFGAVNGGCFLPCAEAELLDCEVKSDSSLEREPVEDDSKGVDNGKKRKRKPYRPGKSPD